MTAYPEFPWTQTQIDWIEHLEGKRDITFQQGDGCLYDGSNCTYCCLGVACEINAEKVEALFVPVFHYDDDGEPETMEPDHYAFLGEFEFLPKEVAALLDMRSSRGDPQIPKWLHVSWTWDNGQGIPLTDLPSINDWGYSFEKIADHLRRFPHFYFKNGGIPTRVKYPYLEDKR